MYVNSETGHGTEIQKLWNQVYQGQHYISKLGQYMTRLETCKSALKRIGDTELYRHLYDTRTYISSVNSLFGNWDWEGQRVHEFLNTQADQLIADLNGYADRLSALCTRLDVEMDRISLQLLDAKQLIASCQDRINQLSPR